MVDDVEFAAYWFGLIALGVVVLRVVWILFKGAPDLDDDLVDDRVSMPRHLTRDIVHVRNSFYGVLVVTTFSQQEIDEMRTHPRFTRFDYFREFSEVNVIRHDREDRALATFDLRRARHRQALGDALVSGAIHLCAADCVNEQDGMIDGRFDGMMLSVDIAPSAPVVRFALADIAK